MEEQSAIKKAEETAKIREMRKFGKKVQVEKQLERQKKKTEEMEKIQLLRKSKSSLSIARTILQVFNAEPLLFVQSGRAQRMERRRTSSTLKSTMTSRIAGARAAASRRASRCGRQRGPPRTPSTDSEARSAAPSTTLRRAARMFPALAFARTRSCPRA
jgi:hypothetical protein